MCCVLGVAVAYARGSFCGFPGGPPVLSRGGGGGGGGGWQTSWHQAYTMHIDILAHQMPQTLFLFQHLVLETGKKATMRDAGFSVHAKSDSPIPTVSSLEAYSLSAPRVMPF